jgi:phenylalanyl-tRNA synthetase beta chain
VMGGSESMVDEHTTEIILESANFNSVSIRRTARLLNLRTDASSRYEKSLPVEFTNIAASFAVGLLEKYAGAKAIEFASE